MNLFWHYFLGSHKQQTHCKAETPNTGVDSDYCSLSGSGTNSEVGSVASNISSGASSTTPHLMSQQCKIWKLIFLLFDIYFFCFIFYRRFKNFLKIEMFFNILANLHHPMPSTSTGSMSENAFSSKVGKRKSVDDMPSKSISRNFFAQVIIYIFLH